MASGKAVTLDNLVALGPERLAAILVELADGDAEIKRRLRLDLAAQAGDDTIAAEISKRLTALRSARSFVDWQQRRDFVKGLDLQRAIRRPGWGEGFVRSASAHADVPTCSFSPPSQFLLPVNAV